MHFSKGVLIKNSKFLLILLFFEKGLDTGMLFDDVVYSYFKKGCRKKCTRQSRKVLWVVLGSLFFKESWKNGTRGHGHMFASAKGKQQK